MSVRIAFIVSAFMLWYSNFQSLKGREHDLHQKELELSNERDTCDHPDLVAEIQQEAWRPVANSSVPTLALIAWVRITDREAPTVVTDYEGELRLSDGRMVKGRNEFIKNEINFVDYTFLDANQSALYAKTEENPIDRGASRHGILEFTFFGVSQRDMLLKPELAITFSDVNGKRYEVTRRITRLTKHLSYIPGGPGITSNKSIDDK